MTPETNFEVSRLYEKQAELQRQMDVIDDEIAAIYREAQKNDPPREKSALEKSIDTIYRPEIERQNSLTQVIWGGTKIVTDKFVNFKVPGDTNE